MGKTKNRSKQKKLATKPPFLLPGYFLAIAVCFVIPLMHFEKTFDPVLYPRFTALGSTVFILSILIYIDKRKKRIQPSLFRNGFFIVFFLFILMSAISLFFAINPIEGITDILKWTMVFLLAFLATCLMLQAEWFFEILVKAIIINAIVFCVYGIFLYFENAFLNTDPNALYEVKGLMAHKNQFSVSLFVILPFLFSGWLTLKNIWRAMAVLAILMVLLMILILQTRAVWLAIIISGMITIFILFIVNYKKQVIQLQGKARKRLLMAGLSALVLVLGLVAIYPVGPLKSIHNRINTAFDPAYTSNIWRLEMWNATTRLVQDKAFTGAGAGNWKIAVYPYYSEYLPSVYRHWRNPHNDYLLALSEKGIVGVVLFVSLFLLLLYYGIRNLVRSASIHSFLQNGFFVFVIPGYMVISFFSFPNERINHLIFIALIAATILSNYLKQPSPAIKEGIQFRWVLLPILLLSYASIHFGILAISSEINIVKARFAQEKKAWDLMKKFAGKGYFRFAPIEPKFSFPVSLYSGIAHFQQGNYNEALHYFKKSYKQHPTNISVLNNMGSVYGQMKMYDSTIVYYRKSLDIFPHYEFGLLNLARSYYINQDFEKAYQTILRCDPRSTNEEIKQARSAIEAKLE